MSAYLNFALKRLAKRKSNYMILLFCMGIVSVLFVMNLRSQNTLSETLTSQIAIFEEDNEKITKVMETLDPASEEYQLYQDHTNNNDLNVIEYQKAIDLFEAQEWTKFYAQYGKLLDEQIEIMNNTLQTSQQEGESDTILAGMTKQKQYIEYLAENHLEYENQDFPIFGFTFTTSLVQFFLPILMIAKCIYVITQLYTFDDDKNISISNLFPINQFKLLVLKLALGIMISLGIVFVLVAFSFLLSSIVTMNTGLNYPVIIERLNDILQVIPVQTLFMQWGALIVLFVIHMNIFTYLISRFVREEVSLLLSLLCFIIGLPYLPNFIGLLQPIAQFLPTTYLHFIDILNGALANKWNNMSLSFNTGTIALTIWSVLEFGFLLFLQKKDSSLNRSMAAFRKCYTKK